MKFFGVVVVACCLISGTVYADDAMMQQGADKAMPSDANMNKAMSNKFFAENKSKAGVVQRPSGLQYKVIKPGNGASPSANDVVTVNYAGRLLNGKEFDSSYKRGEPATFPVNAVIPGWVEALQIMKPGAVWEVYIPANLAYGEQGAPPAIGPNEPLIFKIELLGIKKS